MTKLLSPHIDEITGLEIRHIVLERATLNDSSEVVVRHKNEEYTNRDKQGVNSAHLLECPLLRFQIKDGFFAGAT